MPDSIDRPEQGRSVSSSYGPDWVGLDVRRMRSRQEDYVGRMREAAERETARLKREEEELKEFLSSARDRHLPTKSPSSGDGDLRDRAVNLPAPRPAALIQRFHAENLKSFAGRHDVPLAPLTLIYGPNSAGKSAVLNGLKLFWRAVDEGRSDALSLWRRAFPNTRLESVITWEQQPEDVPYSQTRTLNLGVDYRIAKTGELALAELGFQDTGIGPWQSSAMGVADAGDVVRKEFFLNYEEAEPPDRGAYGAPQLQWQVREWTGVERPDPEPRAMDHELFAHPDAALQGTLFRLAGQLTHFGPHRGNPQDTYTPANLNDIAGPDHWGIAGAPRWGISGFKGHEVLNQALEQLEIDHRFEPVLRAEAGNVSISDWQLIDTRSGAPVSLADVGYGVSQLLPIIDVCLHATQRIICIEEPELHLHPRLQAKLGNLFAASVLGRGNQVIVETHSESILLRVRRLVRHHKLHKDDVAVLYVDYIDGEGAKVRRLPLGEHGELLEPWPAGFFDDRLADVLGITK